MSPRGKVFARVHDRWGLDPGMYFSDDVIAYNARLAFTAALAKDEPEPAEDLPVATPGKIVTDLEERMKAYE